MGMGMPYLSYLSRRGHLDAPGTAILDVGSQCLLGATTEALLEFIGRHGGDPSSPAVRDEVERIAYFSTPRPGERTSYLSELTDLTALPYTSYDVCPALKTEIFDLNRESVPQHYLEHFGVVFNFGTTEHVVNQFNCFKVIHDALAIGGVAFHQLPSAGWIDHGYFCYHAALFRDLAASNDYEILDVWYTPTGHVELTANGLAVRAAESPEVHGAPPGWIGTVPCFLLNIMLRKRSSRAFKLPLELATAHAGLAENIAVSDVPLPAAPLDGTQFVAPAPAAASAPDLSQFRAKVIARELGRRILRRVVRFATSAT